MSPQDRAQRVAHLVETYRQQHDADEVDVETVLIDLVADVRHYADEVGANWERVAHWSGVHHRAEVAGDD